MRVRMRSLIVTALAAAGAVLAMPAVAHAAPSTSADSETVGWDISYPQCGSWLPSSRGFAVVGVNGGLPTRENPCLSSQLAWAWRSTDTVPGQPAAQLYVNTANPGEVRHLITTWPATGTTPYGVCDGENTAACSWRYGWDRAQETVTDFFTPAAEAADVTSDPAQYVWWLDVETENTWQYGSDEARSRNRATLEGMAAYLLYRGGEVGLYSTHQQWGQIVGPVGADSNLAGRDSWLAGATSLDGARANCELAPLVPDGVVALAQYVRGLDRNLACA